MPKGANGPVRVLPGHGPELVRLENDKLRVDVAPAVGGRVVSVFDKAAGYEFLWRNASLPLQRAEPGAEYDPVFWGGIDELLPNDIPETVDGYTLPDHGELWTTALAARIEGERLILEAELPRSGLRYRRTMTLRGDEPVLTTRYRVTNTTAATRHLMFKLHAAIAIAPGDQIVCPAATARVGDPAYSRWKTREPFAWPHVSAAERADVVPPSRGEMDFLYLYDLARGEMAWRRASAGLEFRYTFDPHVFSCAWLFASYGGFQGHEVAILEPCTTMPISVAEAAASGRCLTLEAGQTLETTVEMRAGAV